MKIRYLTSAKVTIYRMEEFKHQELKEKIAELEKENAILIFN